MIKDAGKTKIAEANALNADKQEEDAKKLEEALGEGPQSLIYAQFVRDFTHQARKKNPFTQK